MKETESTKHKILYVECPRWVKRKMRRNLNLAAHTKVNKKRARIATKILAALAKEAESKQKPAGETGQAEACKPIPTEIQGRPSKIWQFFSAIYHKIRDAFRKFKSKFRSVIGKIAGRGRRSKKVHTD